MDFKDIFLAILAVIFALASYGVAVTSSLAWWGTGVEVCFLWLVYAAIAKLSIDWQ